MAKLGSAWAGPRPWRPTFDFSVSTSPRSGEFLAAYYETKRPSGSSVTFRLLIVSQINARHEPPHSKAGIPISPCPLENTVSDLPHIDSLKVLTFTTPQNTAIL